MIPGDQQGPSGEEQVHLRLLGVGSHAGLAPPHAPNPLLHLLRVEGNFVVKWAQPHSPLCELETTAHWDQR